MCVCVCVRFIFDQLGNGKMGNGAKIRHSEFDSHRFGTDMASVKVKRFNVNWTVWGTCGLFHNIWSDLQPPPVKSVSHDLDTAHWIDTRCDNFHHLTHNQQALHSISALPFGRKRRQSFAEDDNREYFDGYKKINANSTSGRVHWAVEWIASLSISE